MRERIITSEESWKLLRSSLAAMNAVRSLLSLARVDALLAKECYRRPKSLIPCGFKAYSQNDEDGLIKKSSGELDVRSEHL